MSSRTEVTHERGEVSTPSAIAEKEPTWRTTSNHDAARPPRAPECRPGHGVDGSGQRVLPPAGSSTSRLRRREAQTAVPQVRRNAWHGGGRNGPPDRCTLRSPQPQSDSTRGPPRPRPTPNSLAAKPSADLHAHIARKSGFTHRINGPRKSAMNAYVSVARSSSRTDYAAHPRGALTWGALTERNAGGQ